MEKFDIQKNLLVLDCLNSRLKYQDRSVIRQKQVLQTISTTKFDNMTAKSKTVQNKTNSWLSEPEGPKFL